MYRKLSFLLVILLIACGNLLAQSAEANPGTKTDPRVAPSFTSSSQLVLVPVVVTDRKGAHVDGLGREAFTIEENGQARKFTVFEEVRTWAAKARPQAATLEGRSNFTLDDTNKWRLTVVVLDMLNTPYLRQAEAKRRLIGYLSKSLQREEPTALFGLGSSGLKQLHPFTTDTAVLLAALQKVKGQISPDEINEQSAAGTADTAASMAQASGSDAQMIADFLNDSEATFAAFQQRAAIRTTLTAMTQLAHAYRAIPGRKTLIWASGGFPFMIDDPQAFARMGTDMAEKYEETWRTLIAADIAVYTVDVTGLGGGSSNLGSANASATRRTAGTRPINRMGMQSAVSVPYDKGVQKLETLRAFANATGGIPCVNTNDIESCFARAVEDSRSYYLLGYYLPSDDHKPGWRKLKVKVAGEGLHLRGRQGFYVGAPAKDTPEERRRQIVDALRSPVEFTGIRLNVREAEAGAAVKPAEGKSRHEFMVGIVGDSLTIDEKNANVVDVTIVAVAFTTGGKDAGQAENRVSGKLNPETLRRLRQAGLGVKQSLELAPGKYDVRFVVRDNLSGNVGSIGYPLDVK